MPFGGYRLCVRPGFGLGQFFEAVFRDDNRQPHAQRGQAGHAGENAGDGQDCIGDGQGEAQFLGFFGVVDFHEGTGVLVRHLAISCRSGPSRTRCGRGGPGYRLARNMVSWKGNTHMHNDRRTDQLWRG